MSRHEWRQAFAMCLKKEKSDRNLSYRELGRLTGVSYSLLHHYVVEAKTPALTNAMKIATKLGISLDNIMTKGVNYYREG